MKEWLTAFLKSAGRKLLILGSIALVTAAVLFIASRPVMREPIAETIRREGSAFTVDGLGAGTTREDVIVWMDARHYTWTEGQKREYVEGTYYDELFRDLEGVTWISLAEETRVSELGSASVRRHYYFRDGLLTHIDLEMDPTKKPPAEGVRRTEAVTKALEAAWGAPASADELQRLLEEHLRRTLLRLIGGDGEIVNLRFTRCVTEDAMTDADRAALILPTQALHAWRLRFAVPGTDEAVACESAPPDAMLNLFGTDSGGILSEHA